MLKRSRRARAGALLRVARKSAMKSLQTAALSANPLDSQGAPGMKAMPSSPAAARVIAIRTACLATPDARRLATPGR